MFDHCLFFFFFIDDIQLRNSCRSEEENLSISVRFQLNLTKFYKGGWRRIEAERKEREELKKQQK